ASRDLEHEAREGQRREVDPQARRTAREAFELQAGDLEPLAGPKRPGERQITHHLPSRTPGARGRLAPASGQVLLPKSAQLLDDALRLAAQPNRTTADLDPAQRRTGQAQRELDLSQIDAEPRDPFQARAHPGEPEGWVS